MESGIEFSGRPFHFIGIGGIGMSAIAHILARRKLPISGSDIRLNQITQRLQEQGAHIFLGHKADNLKFFQDEVPGSVSQICSVHLEPTRVGQNEGSASSVGLSQLPQVICSTAIHADNPEYSAAQAMGCPIYHRSDVLAALMNCANSIAVAGTHGKTTTSSMIGYVLLQVGLDPTIIVGGEVEAWGGNAYLGDGDYLVAEADESDGSLVKFAAKIGVITNIELDHPDHYQSLGEVVDIFQTFSDNCAVVVGCIDCDNVRQYLNPAVTYSIHSDSDATYRADQVYCRGGGTQAQIYEGDRLLGELWLPVLGQHNLSNALAAIAVARMLGVEFSAIATALKSFKGARRRFESYGEYHGITFIDDYAHHPSEVQATLSAARLLVESKGQGRKERGRVVAVFQPHRYSRAAMFVEEFGLSFDQADVVLVTEVYGAGEIPDRINGQCMAEAIATHHANVFYRSTLEDVTSLLKQSLRPNDLVMFLGAGNLNRVIPDLVDFYHRSNVSDLAMVFGQLVS
ncbi:MAG: UDP-N-acetylmuramate--L-alanine ligase [Cyanothece sp. SIO2G6]|nr:UDP-N-acetylmuramate--L-alanine ligase [Cyanothece sp. SIO2G6]